MIVIDASIAVKWFRDEADSDLAAQFFANNSGRLIAPDVFAIEVVAALVRNANEVKAIRPAMEQAVAAFEAVLNDKAVALVNATSAGRLSAADIALDIGHPLKDCLYLQLAMTRGCPLATADARFAAKARAIYEGVTILGEG